MWKWTKSRSKFYSFRSENASFADRIFKDSILSIRLLQVSHECIPPPSNASNGFLLMFFISLLLLLLLSLFYHWLHPLFWPSSLNRIPICLNGVTHCNSIFGDKIDFSFFSLSENFVHPKKTQRNKFFPKRSCLQIASLRPLASCPANKMQMRKLNSNPCERIHCAICATAYILTCLPISIQMKLIFISTSVISFCEWTAYGSSVVALLSWCAHSVIYSSTGYSHSTFLLAYI